jgi:predicted DNA-binding transcriptional regulator YafY
MQYMTRYMVMLKVFDLIGKMPSGGGWVVAKDLVQWTNISRPTIYRYLRYLTKQGVIIKVDHAAGNRVYSQYKLSQDGQTLYNSQKSLFNWE